MTMSDDFKNNLFLLMEETFESKHHGIFLDKGTSLFETLETVSAQEASIPVGGKCASLAAQVAHAAIGAFLAAGPQGQGVWLQVGMPKIVVYAADAEVLKGRDDVRHAAALLARKFPQWGTVPPEDVAFVKIVPRVISILDYTQGFGHTDLVRV